jgi:DNA-binding transcriptional regulator LsrR (DeoR family)
MEKKMTDQQTLIECAARGAQIYAEQHPRPSQVTQAQAAEMLGISAQTVGRMVRAGRLPLNKLGYIPISVIDRALLVK